MRSIFMLFLVTASALWADRKEEVAYLERLIEDLQNARTQALAAGNEAEATRLFRELENARYVLAQLLTQKVPKPESAPPAFTATPAEPAPEPLKPIAVDSWTTLSAKDWFQRIHRESGLAVVFPEMESSASYVTVPPGQYDPTTLALAVSEAAGFEGKVMKAPEPLVVAGLRRGEKP